MKKMIIAGLALVGCSEAPRMQVMQMDPPPVMMETPPPPTNTMTVDLTQPTPDITNVTPARVATSGGTEITIAGTNFHPQVVVFVNGVQIAKTSSTATEIKANSPPIPGKAGLVSVSVRNPSGNSKVVGDKLTYYPSIFAFANQFKLQIQNNPYYVEVGDFNLDGKTDIVATNNSANTISVLLNNSAVGQPLTYAAQVTYGTGSSPRGIVIGKFTDDNYDDVVVSNASSNYLSFFKGQAGGTFEQNVNVGGTSATPWGMAMGDLDSNGTMDIVVANYSSNNIGVFKGSGTGTFPGGQVYAPGTYAQPEIIALGDINKDGKLDMVACHVNDSTIRVWQGVGNGDFTNVVNPGGVSTCRGVALADLDKDGDLEIITTNYNQHTLSIFDAQGTNFSWSGNVQYPTGICPRDVRVDDLNGDGSPDIVVADHCDGGNTEYNSVTVLPGNGTTKYTQAMFLPTGLNPYGIKIADMNNDNKKDIVVVNAYDAQYFGNSVSVILNISQ